MLYTQLTHMPMLRARYAGTVRERQLWSEMFNQLDGRINGCLFGFAETFPPISKRVAVLDFPHRVIINTKEYSIKRLFDRLLGSA